MRQELERLLERSYSPYSNFKVAAMVTMKDGKNFYGVNIENASYGATVCAERVAIFNAVLAGYKKGDFKRLVVMTPTDKYTFPCFICRQVLAEFFTGEEELVLMNKMGTKNYYMSDILTHPFSIEDLKWKVVL